MHRCFATLAAALMCVGAARAYIEVPHSFGQVVGQSSNIVLMRVESVDKEKNLIIYRKIRDVKGVHASDVIKHNIGRGGLRPNEWKPPMEWAEPGKIAVFFYNGGASETCIGNWWYQAYAGGEWWNHSHGEPFLLRTYAGAPEKLPPLVTAVMEGKEVVVPCMMDGNKEDLHNRTAKIQRLKASLKIQDYNQKRDFVGWGGEEFRRVLGMPGFTHITALARSDPDAQAVSSVDFDNDGKLDLCLIGGGKLVILQNNGETLSEIMLTGVAGARSAVWADYNGDGLPDLCLVTPGGPRLFTNLGGGQLRDDSHLLPREAFVQPTAAAWLDADNDGRPDLLLANGYHGLRLYKNLGLEVPPMPKGVAFGKWSILGPIAYSQDRFQAAHPAEKIDLNGTYDGKGGKVAWKRATFNDGAVNNLIDLLPASARTGVSVYLHRSIEVPTPTELPISLGSDDTLAVWLDGKKVLEDPSHRACAPDQNKVTLQLSAGKHDLLLRIGQGDGDFAFYFNYSKPERPIPRGDAFRDISKDVGLGAEGLASDVKFDSLVVTDVNGDGRTDFLYGNRVFLNQAAGEAKVRFSEADPIAFQPQRVGPVVGDFDGDGAADLFVPQRAGSKLFKNDGKGKFIDVTAAAGELAGNLGWVTSAAWGDLDSDGRPDLILGCFKGPNRFLRNKGDGAFEDASAKIGLDQKIFNTQAVACVDVNGDGNLDLVLNNEGQDSTILLGSPALGVGKRMPLTLRVRAKQGVTGCKIQIVTKDGKLIASQEMCGGQGRGSQQGPHVRFALEPGTYVVRLVLSSGQVRTRDFTVGETPVRGLVGDDTP